MKGNHTSTNSFQGKLFRRLPMIVLVLILGVCLTLACKSTSTLSVKKYKPKYETEGMGRKLIINEHKEAKYQP
jgi:hypothetical protein